jgi:hypothetical protein
MFERIAAPNDHPPRIAAGLRLVSAIEIIGDDRRMWPNLQGAYRIGGPIRFNDRWPDR